MKKVDAKIEKQITELLGKMSVREKLGQCIMIEPIFLLEELNKKNNNKFKSLTDPEFLKIIIDEYHIGFLLFGGISRIGEDKLVDWADYFKKVNKFVEERNGIPLLYGVDAVHGVNFVKETAIFSHNLGAISSWNTDLIKEYGTIVSKELDSIGMNCNFAPTIDIAKDQRWGRVYESFGEDPYLASEMAGALVEGLQQKDKVAACAKHYVGYGASNNGTDRSPADISDRELYEIHLPPFVEAIEKGVKTIMVNGADLNGMPVPASSRVLKDVLRDELGFRGITMSDWEDVSRLQNKHYVAKDRKEAYKVAFNAGLDMNMAVLDLEAVDLMEELVNDKEITMERLDEAVGNILRVKLGLDLYNRSEIDVDQVAKREFLEESKDIARRVTEESITLLKNENVLPLSGKHKNILVTGKVADSKRHMCGGWTLNWASANEEDLDFETLIDALREHVGPSVKITYISDLERLKKLKAKTTFDVVLSFVGEEPHSEWLGDTKDLLWEQDEFDMLKEANKFKCPQVMISLIGRPMKMNWVDENVDAILWTYYPGSEGAKPVIETLYGKHNPSGKLPITFVRDSNQIPTSYHARRYGDSNQYDPLYPFGYGLSYTSFNYSNLSVDQEVKLGEDLKVQVKLTNTGRVKGTEIVQLYVSDLYASVARPKKLLKGFERVTLEPNESKVLTFTLTEKELSFFDERFNFVNEKRKIQIEIGELNKEVEII